MLKKIELFISRWKKIYSSLKSNLIRLDLIEMNQTNIILQEYEHLNNHKKDQRKMLREKEYKIYSQHGEDGLIMYIFSLIGTTNKKVLEIGIGNGRECNSANLIINFGWDGLLIDGNSTQVNKAKKYYAKNTNKEQKVQIIHHFVDCSNINQILLNENCQGNIDLLSIDIDGNDYWIWEKIENLKPRVIIIEYNASFGSGRSVSVPYDKIFMRFKKHKTGWYHGASLKALIKLGKKKGYSLIGCDQSGVNAIFLKNEELKNSFTPIHHEEAFYPCRKRNKLASLNQQFDIIKNLPLVEI